MTRLTFGRRGRWAAVIGVVLAVAGATAITAPAQAAYAPVDQPGPPLSVPAATLAASLQCSQSLATVRRDVILMVPPTIFDPGEAYGPNYQLAFQAHGWPYCSVTFPDHSDGDVQINGEYVVNAVRAIHAATHRQVELFGWSQGASTAPRWALRWWPDIRPMVASLVGLAPDNEGGSDTAAAVCVLECVPAAWQEVRRITGAPSHFMAALDSLQQTFPGIAYTDIYSLTDEVAGLNVGPAPVGPLPPAANVLNVTTQSICPLQLVEHLDITTSSAAYSVAAAALATPGRLPDVSAIQKSAVCADPLMPYMTPASFVAFELRIAALVGPRLLTGTVPREPPLACYVTNTCP